MLYVIAALVTLDHMQGLVDHAGVAVQMSQAGENISMAPPEFLRLQYSTDPPLSAENSRETSPEQSAGAAQAAPTGMQVLQSTPPCPLGLVIKAVAVACDHCHTCCGDGVTHVADLHMAEA